jgi:hypothetical protein
MALTPYCRARPSERQRGLVNRYASYGDADRTLLVVSTNCQFKTHVVAAQLDMACFVGNSLHQQLRDNSPALTQGIGAGFIFNFA